LKFSFSKRFWKKKGGGGTASPDTRKRQVLGHYDLLFIRNRQDENQPLCAFGISLSPVSSLLPSSVVSHI